MQPPKQQQAAPAAAEATRRPAKRARGCAAQPSAPLPKLAAEHLAAMAAYFAAVDAQPLEEEAADAATAAPPAKRLRTSLPCCADAAAEHAKAAAAAAATPTSQLRPPPAAAAALPTATPSPRRLLAMYPELGKDYAAYLAAAGPRGQPLSQRAFLDIALTNGLARRPRHCARARAAAQAAPTPGAPGHAPQTSAAHDAATAYDGFLSATPRPEPKQPPPPGAAGAAATGSAAPRRARTREVA